MAGIQIQAVKHPTIGGIPAEGTRDAGIGSEATWNFSRGRGEERVWCFSRGPAFCSACVRRNDVCKSPLGPAVEGRADKER